MALAIVVMVFLVIMIAVLVLSTISAIIFAVLAIVVKKNGKSNKIYKIISFCCLIPLILFIGYGEISNISTERNYKDSLAYQLLHCKYEKAEKILDKGVSPDCGIESNDEVTDGTDTLLFSLIGTGYYYPPLMNVNVPESERIDMMIFLLEHGANPDKTKYYHEKDYRVHAPCEELPGVKKGDMCGSTYFMYSVYNDDMYAARILLQYGADINAINYSGYNAAAIAAETLEKSRADDFLEFLNENGCDMNVETNFGKTPKEIYENRFNEAFKY